MSQKHIQVPQILSHFHFFFVTAGINVCIGLICVKRKTFFGTVRNSSTKGNQQAVLAALKSVPCAHYPSPCQKTFVIETKSIVSILFFFFFFSPLFLFPWAHPVSLQAWKLFSGGVIRLGLNSPAGRPVCDWRRPVPSACHLLTCLTGWGQQPETGSLDSVFYSWAKNKKKYNNKVWKKKNKKAMLCQGPSCGGPSCWFKPRPCFDKFWSVRFLDFLTHFCFLPLWPALFALCLVAASKS